MHTGRVMTLVLAAAGVGLIWTGVERSRHTDAASDGAAGERATVRFFRNAAAAPAFSAVDLEGRRVSSDSLKGKVVIVNFWATWCPPCRAEIPDLIALQEKYRDQLQIIGVS